MTRKLFQSVTVFCLLGFGTGRAATGDGVAQATTNAVADGIAVSISGNAARLIYDALTVSETVGAGKESMRTFHKDGPAVTCVRLLRPDGPVAVKSEYHCGFGVTVGGALISR